MTEASVADCAVWLGVPIDQLSELVEHPALCRALIEVRKVHDEWEEGPAPFAEVMGRSGLHPEQIFARHDLPVVDPDGLDVNKLRLELQLLSGSEGVVEERKLYGLSFGRMQKAEARVKELRLRAEQVVNLLVGAQVAIEAATNHPNHMPDKDLGTAEKRVSQAIENLQGGLEKTGGNE